MLTVQAGSEVKSKRKTDFWSFWSLRNDQGRQVWEFDEDKARTRYKDIDDNIFNEELTEAFKFDKSLNANSGDLVYRNQVATAGSAQEIPRWLSESSNFSNSRIKKAAISSFKAIEYYKKLQADDGHWPGDYGGPLFLLPGLIIASHITQTPFDQVKQQLMKSYMLNHQNEDGGWGLHIEGNSTMFGTVMQYCALRILGMESTGPQLKKAQNWIRKHGDARGMPSWGKFFLSLLGVYDWKGCHTLMPEMWLLPKWLPIHPWRYWCHARMVYLPMSYCYGHRITAVEDDLLKSIKNEIYSIPFEEVPWEKQRNNVCQADRFFATPKFLRVLLSVMNLYESLPLSFLRKRSLKFILDYIDAEDDQTDYIDIGPVNQIINSICIWHAYGKTSNQFQKHVDRWQDYLWLAEDGMKMNGYNGSQLWDTAFATQSLMEHHTDLFDHQTVFKAYGYINQSQIKEEVKQRVKFFRHPSVGGWPFSTLHHGWPISDCTAEGLKATLLIHSSPLADEIKGERISQERLGQAVDLILSFQNKDGGWATYENTRSGPYLELLNPTEVFGKIMIDYSWVECSSACITALSQFRKANPTYRTTEIDRSVIRGIEFILKQQRADGSWIGSWGVCFTYGTWFGVEALVAARDSVDTSEALKKACDFLANHQNKDGGWGESYLSCVNSEYTPHDTSQVINSSWALLALMSANYQNILMVEKGIDFLINRQQNNGDWLQEGISGVFNQNCMITYTAYRNIFPIWALGRYLKKYSGTLNYRGDHLFK